MKDWDGSWPINQLSNMGPNITQDAAISILRLIFIAWILENTKLQLTVTFFNATSHPKNCTCNPTNNNKKYPKSLGLFLWRNQHLVQPKNPSALWAACQQTESSQNWSLLFRLSCQCCCDIIQCNAGICTTLSQQSSRSPANWGVTPTRLRGYTGLSDNGARIYFTAG